MFIAIVVTRGFGNGTFTGKVSKIVTYGYDIKIQLSPWTDKTKVATNWAEKQKTVTNWVDRT